MRSLGNDFPVCHSSLRNKFPETNAGVAKGCGNCWKLRLVVGHTRNMMKNVLSILNVLFLQNSKNKDLRQKAVNFPIWLCWTTISSQQFLSLPPHQYGFFFLESTVHLWHICTANGPSVIARRIFEFALFRINLLGISNECNLNEISYAPCQ